MCKIPWAQTYIFYSSQDYQKDDKLNIKIHLFKRVCCFSFLLFIPLIVFTTLFLHAAPSLKKFVIWIINTIFQHKKQILFLYQIKIIPQKSVKWQRFEKEYVQSSLWDVRVSYHYLYAWQLYMIVYNKCLE